MSLSLTWSLSPSTPYYLDPSRLRMRAAWLVGAVADGVAVAGALEEGMVVTSC